DEPRHLMIDSELSHGFEPVLNLAGRVSVFLHFFEGSVLIEMNNREGPDIATFADAVAITLGRGHSRIAGEVVGEKTVSVQPSRNPWGLVAVWRGIFDNRFAGDRFQGTLV